MAGLGQHRDALYWAMVAAFLTHELDAARRHEWRILPVLRALPDRVGERAFVLGHAPLLFLLLWGSSSETVRAGLSGFAVIHVALHALLRNHPADEFGNAGSWALIGLTGALGAIWLVSGV